MHMLRIVLVEDDGPTRRRLQEALASDPAFDVVACECLADARDAIARVVPDALVTDLELPDGHGTTLAAEVHAAHPSVAILVISVLCDEQSVVAAIASGASGYVLKDALPEDLTRTVRQVLAGEAPLSPAVARYLLRRIQPHDAKPAPATAKEGDMVAMAEANRIGLTRREVDIMWGIAKGLTYNEIAENLGLSKKTVPNYIKSIYRKLEVNSRGEAVFEALSRNLITM
ncbi:MAG TPA: response regulator transcription factor [Xanthomonadaceae bacterium]|nr:response regulator transcription factor [Xanthomonadaceae bacterium]